MSFKLKESNWLKIHMLYTSYMLVLLKNPVDRSSLFGVIGTYCLIGCTVQQFRDKLMDQKF